MRKGTISMTQDKDVTNDPIIRVKNESTSVQNDNVIANFFLTLTRIASLRLTSSRSRSVTPMSKHS